MPRALMIIPPTTAPTTPSPTSARTPYPAPRMIFPVAQPATSPTMIHHRTYMGPPCLSVGLDDTRGDRVARHTGGVVEIELRHHALPVLFDGLDADGELGGDLLVG